MSKVLGVLMIVVALTVAIVPVYTDCQSQGRQLTLQDGRNVPMKCHWTGIAEIGAALPLALAGVFALGSRRKDSTRFAAIVGAGSSALAIAFPVSLIGVCANPTMVCNLVMRPTLVGAGIVGIVASMALFVLAREPKLPTAEVSE
jgi:hypothetical protein